MAVPYKQIAGGTRPLPRIHIPTWFKIWDWSSDHLSAVLDLDLIPVISDSFSVDEDGSETNDGLLDMSGTNQISDETSNIYKDRIVIGNAPPQQGEIIAYSDDTGQVLEGTNSAHVLYFKHAVLHNFYFAVTHNHIIQRIRKLYRNAISSVDSTKTLTLITSPETNNIDYLPSTYRMVINSVNEPDAEILAADNNSNTSKLKLVEGGH